MAWQPQSESAIQTPSAQVLPGPAELAQVHSAPVLAKLVKGTVLAS